MAELVADTLGSGGALDEQGNAPDLGTTGALSSLGADSPDEPSLDPDGKIFSEAKDRFHRCQTWESTSRQRWLDDLKFAEGDAVNHYQWPNSIRSEREQDQRPCLTINKTRQHNLHIINDAKQNKPSIKIRATGNGATVQSAKVYNALIRHIEYQSNAQVAYDTGISFAVKAGKGWLRLVTDYESPESFRQVPFVRRVTDPLTVYIDPDAKEADKSDANFGFVFDQLGKDEFDRLYPKYAGMGANVALDDGHDWVREDSIRIAEYYRKEMIPDRLYQIVASAGTQVFRRTELTSTPGGRELMVRLEQDAKVPKRDTQTPRVEWFLIIGSKIVEQKLWVGRYVPLIPIIGEETIIQGEYDCKGHTRALLDPQRIYNYMSSTAVEYSAVQTKAPFIAAAEAIEGFEGDWAVANRVNKPVLIYNATSEDGQKEFPPPQRVSPPVSMPAAMEGMQVAMQEMMLASGQYQSEMGQQGNERSAKAINERQQQGANATYHFVDNLAIAVRCVGKQLLDLIPKLYNSEMIMNILAEDGTSIEMQIDPSLAQAMKIEQANAAQSIQKILFNPNVGVYDVQADIGPSWGTKRDETFNALSLILTQAPQLTSLIGDLLLQSSDFDLAQEAAERLRRMVPPQALGSGPTPQEQALQAQLQAVSSMLQETMQSLAVEKIKLRGKDALRGIESYNARTKRLQGLVDSATKQGIPVDPEELKRIILETADETSMHDSELDRVDDAGAPGLSAAAHDGGQYSLPLDGDKPPVPGARRGSDGHYYVRDYQRSNQYKLVS